MQRVLGVLTMIAVFGTVACGGGNVDPGTDGGTNTDGGPGETDGGPKDPVDEIPFSQWCPSVETGHQNWMLKTEAACGQSAITAADLPHVGEGMFGIPVNAIRLTQYVSCEPNAHLGAMTEAFAAAIQAGRMNYDAKKAFECRALGRNSNGNVDPWGGTNYLIEPCGSVLTGNVALGESCQMNEECVKGAYCKPGAADTCSGTCTERLAVGTPCDATRDLCVVDAYCDDDGSGATVCIASPTVGEACDSDFGPMCKAGLVCNASGTCVAPAAKDGACADSSECQSGLLCANKVCVAPAALGEACGANRPACGACLRCQDASEVAEGAQTTCVAAEVGSTCRSDADCPANSFCDASTCALKPRLGESCQVEMMDGMLPLDANRGNCLYNDAFCKRADAASAEGVCTAAPKLGEACARSGAIDKFDCVEGFCSEATGLCTAPQPKDSACSSDDQCAAGLYCNTVCTALPMAGEPCAGENGLCDAMSFCDTSADLPTCKALLGAGEVCGDDSECQTGACNAITNTCMAVCTGNYDASSCGCPGEGAKGYSMYLLFALVLLPGVARRRARK